VHEKKLKFDIGLKQFLVSVGRELLKVVIFLWDAKEIFCNNLFLMDCDWFGHFYVTFTFFLGHLMD